MAIIEQEPVAPLVEEELAEPFDVEEMDEDDRLILGAIEWYDTHEFARGWGDEMGSCILGSLMIQKGHRPTSSGMRSLSVSVIHRIAHAFGFDTAYTNKDDLCQRIIARNDGQGTKEITVEILRKALLNK